jgi:hypothetical protein
MQNTSLCRPESIGNSELRCSVWRQTAVAATASGRALNLPECNWVKALVSEHGNYGGAVASGQEHLE